MIKEKKGTKKAFSQIFNKNEIKLLIKYCEEKIELLKKDIYKLSGQESEYSKVLYRFIDKDASYSFANKIIIKHNNELLSKNDKLLFLLNGTEKQINEKFDKKTAKKYLKIQKDIKNLINTNKFNLLYYDEDKINNDNDLKELLRNSKNDLMKSCLNNLRNCKEGEINDKRYYSLLINNMKDNNKVVFGDGQELYYMCKNKENLDKIHNNLHESIMTKLRNYYINLGDDEKTFISGDTTVF